MKPQFASVAEARRFVYSVIVNVIDKDPRWFTDGIENEFDKRRLALALKRVEAEMVRKAAR
jgi:hypothetical protein